jgi:hypothetical protein
MSWFNPPKIRKPKIPKLPDDFELNPEINVQPLRPPLPADPVAAIQGTAAASPTRPSKPKPAVPTGLLMPDAPAKGPEVLPDANPTAKPKKRKIKAPPFPEY